ncbi:aldo/keto reductase [Amorphus orientalis]|uniref:Diketogulonate reductase-like aldo/keto reductase n=1 Tax=Amorphus orientalis TaxID=649198 RepID=A0AAE4AU53_9HYPH|nr:aldo/keto reductase [Amorphus orientalis]MDQ0315584.1 diketogulonate reductase-like aldo/keto reductase [Amorphus orientalis]
MHTVKTADVHIPALGFGTWPLKGEECEHMVTQALKAGFRHIDTAEMYGNEEAVGRGIKASGVPRDEIFVTTKVWHTHLRDGQLQHAAEDSLQRLGLDHVDLYLIHWPSPEVALAEPIGALNEVRERGLTRGIGVANFNVALIEEASELTDAPLSTNQVEYHLHLNQDPVRDACRKHQMAVTAYAPVARGKVLEEPLVKDIAQRHGKTPAQIALRWLIQQEGVVAIPKTGNPDRLKENLGAYDFELAREEMEELTSLRRPDGRLVRMDVEPEWDT